MRDRIRRAEVVLWSLAVSEPSRAERWTSCLSQEERLQADRFRFARDRSSYIAAHALLRALLATQGVVRPVFARNSWGKPELAGGNAGGLRFSLSHTRDIVAVGLALHADLGVDVERVPPERDGWQIAERVFAPSEVSDLRRLAEPERPAAFCRLWTLKEAFAKAVGQGLALPLDLFAFGPGPADFRCDPALGLPSDWSFYTRATEPEGFLSVALRTARPPGFAVSDHRLGPDDVDDAVQAILTAGDRSASTGTS